MRKTISPDPHSKVRQSQWPQAVLRSTGSEAEVRMANHGRCIYVSVKLASHRSSTPTTFIMSSSQTTQETVDATLTGIISSLLGTGAWDPCSGYVQYRRQRAPTNQRTFHSTYSEDQKAALGKAISVSEVILQSATSLLSRLRRRRNEILSSIYELPTELLVDIWKLALPKGRDY